MDSQVFQQGSYFTPLASMILQVLCNNNNKPRLQMFPCVLYEFRVYNYAYLLYIAAMVESPMFGKYVCVKGKE